MAAIAKTIGTKRRGTFRLLLATLAVCWLCLGLLALAADDASRLRGKYESLSQQLEHNQFRRPLYLESAESPTALKGDIYAVVDYPFATVSGALNDPVHGPANWCDLLILHLNIKYCHASTGSNGSIVSVNIGRKVEQKVADTYRVQFHYHASPTSPGYFQVVLNADSGPLSTKDYRIVLEAVDISGDRTFLHLTYSYSYGMAGRLAMKTYLATIGSDKVGFTTASAPSSEQTEYIGGVRGLVERNTMRYYLAIDAYLGALSNSPDKRLEQRLTNWFDATEQYPRQLHELDRQEYLQMKHKEYERQQTEQ
ncbi:hypothetical protein P0D88_37215 [Paraburkholderia sp. RL18-103-BIB-C]|jgi:hypothetical protein|uniref:hypothetical protein n=1 Tax=unclassified Paraburkholderia TaxID=2615204 RepID=UPI0038B880B8